MTFKPKEAGIVGIENSHPLQMTIDTYFLILRNAFGTRSNPETYRKTEKRKV